MRCRKHPLLFRINKPLLEDRFRIMLSLILCSHRVAKGNGVAPSSDKVTGSVNICQHFFAMLNICERKFVRLTEEHLTDTRQSRTTCESTVLEPNHLTAEFFEHRNVFVYSILLNRWRQNYPHSHQDIETQHQKQLVQRLLRNVCPGPSIVVSDH